MGSAFTDAVLLLWDWLPQITVLLKFFTALAAFVLTVPPLARRALRRLRTRLDR
ncbi:hypothetical protein [Streptomyces sp. enrichment culture]|uniref:hypothetical protein n=1 Tax=Streptomyces sp. enrichment culture TaxID=1795815 RepID=UPI003F568668